MAVPSSTALASHLPDSHLPVYGGRYSGRSFDKQTDKAMTTDMFISTVHKYTRAKKLSEHILNELIKRIEVHQSEKADGVHK